MQPTTRRNEAMHSASVVETPPFIPFGPILASPKCRCLVEVERRATRYFQLMSSYVSQRKMLSKHLPLQHRPSRLATWSMAAMSPEAPPAPVTRTLFPLILAQQRNDVTWLAKPIKRTRLIPRLFLQPGYSERLPVRALLSFARGLPLTPPCTVGDRHSPIPIFSVSTIRKVAGLWVR